MPSGAVEPSSAVEPGLGDNEEFRPGRRHDPDYVSWPVRLGWVSAFAGLFISLGAIVISVIIPQVLAWAGKNPGRWSTFLLCLAIPLAILGMMRFICVKENVVQSADTMEKVTFREIFAALRDNKYIWGSSGLWVWRFVACVRGWVGDTPRPTPETGTCDTPAW